MQMPDIFVVLSVILILASVRTLITTIRTRDQLFDDQFTLSDRHQLSQAAFLLLLPLSVLLHEAGHAVAVALFGHEITGFGYYFFYGYVSYLSPGIAMEDFWIALSGNLVSIALGLGAIVLPLWRPQRPPVNYLLLMFAVIDLLNSLVFYPLLDFGTGLGGDWSQIYRINDTPILSGVTGAFHAVLLAASLVVWRNDRLRQRIADRLGLPRMLGRRPTKTQLAGELLRAGEQLSTSWQHPLRIVADAPDGATGITMHWTSRGYGRVVGAFATDRDGQYIELQGGIQPVDATADAYQQPIARIAGVPTTDQLVPILTRALDIVERWEPTPPTAE